LKTIKYAQQPKELNGQQVIVPRPPPRQRPGLTSMSNGDSNRVSPEPTDLPTEQRSDPKERILKMLRNQGVPVFPGLSFKVKANG
jgi:hypothetical protein